MISMTNEELQARYIRCKTENLCFVSLRSLGNDFSAQMFDERHQPYIRFEMGDIFVLTEYVKNVTGATT
jgi:hypothetical protein